MALHAPRSAGRVPSGGCRATLANPAPASMKPAPPWRHRHSRAIRRAAAPRRQRLSRRRPGRCPTPSSSRSPACSTRHRAARHPRQPRREGGHGDGQMHARWACPGAGGRDDRRRPARRARLQHLGRPDAAAVGSTHAAPRPHAWTIVVLHHPPYSAGYQGSNDRRRATPSRRSFERYGVQLVLSGHDHDYQRSTPINGVTYVVSGAARPTPAAPARQISPPCRSRGTTSSTSASSPTTSCYEPSTRTRESPTSLVLMPDVWSHGARCLSAKVEHEPGVDVAGEDLGHRFVHVVQPPRSRARSWCGRRRGARTSRRGRRGFRRVSRRPSSP